jgi:TolA-binding protein
VYTNPQVVELVGKLFVPVRVHVRENQEEYKRLASRYNAQWTPTILIVDGEGKEQYRIEGFLPVDDFLSQLLLGAAHAAFRQQDYATAERRFREVLDRFSQSEAAPEALYWAGVAKYRSSNDPGALKATAEAFAQRYQGSTWAKKASVWK